MKVAAAIANIMKREGIDFLIGYPVNPIIEAAAEADIRPIMVRQERIGLHMCDAIAKVTSGDRIGVFAMQHGPGTENAFGGVAQSYGDSCPVVVLPAGYARDINQVRPNFNAALNFQHVTKWCEQVTVETATVEAMRRAFTQVRNGRPGPVLVEFPTDILRADISDDLVAEYTPAPIFKTGPDAKSISKIAEALVAAQRPVICAGQGVHYGKAWPQLKQLAELLEAPVMTTLPGKSAFPESHPLSLGSGGIGISKALHVFLQNADLVFGIGCSFTRSSFATPMPKGMKIAHATLDPVDINKDVPTELAAIGDAGLVLDAVLAEVKDRLKGKTSRPSRQGHRRHPRPQRRVDGPVDASPDCRHQAAVAVSRDLGSIAHGRSRQHDHHPRRRQPARSAEPVLAEQCAAFLYRLGQDDPARLRSRPGDGREIGGAGQDLH